MMMGFKKAVQDFTREELEIIVDSVRLMIVTDEIDGPPALVDLFDDEMLETEEV